MRSAMCAASQLPGRGPSDVDESGEDDDENVVCYFTKSICLKCDDRKVNSVDPDQQLLLKQFDQSLHCSLMSLHCSPNLFLIDYCLI